MGCRGRLRASGDDFGRAKALPGWSSIVARNFVAQNLRGVIKEMDRLYPGLGLHLEEETTVAIDGAIHETAYFQPIREGCEIFFIPKLEGG